MTLRLSDDDHALLAEEAARTGVSMHSLAVEAIRTEMNRRAQRAEIIEITGSIQEHHRSLLDRLAE